MAQLSDNQIGLRVCPKCLRAFYAHEELKIVCPGCGYIIFDRRYAERIGGVELDFVITVPGGTIAARLQDYSDSGIKMVYKGTAIGVGTVVSLDIPEINLHKRAKAVWSNSLDGGSAIGLTFLKNTNKRLNGKQR